MCHDSGGITVTVILNVHAGGEFMVFPSPYVYIYIYTYMYVMICVLVVLLCNTHNSLHNTYSLFHNCFSLDLVKLHSEDGRE